jgi:hypothetical protein
MAQPANLTTAIADAKRKVTERTTASEAIRQDTTLRGLRKELKRLQRRRRAEHARQARLDARAAKKTTGGDAAKTG